MERKAALRRFKELWEVPRKWTDTDANEWMGLYPKLRAAYGLELRALLEHEDGKLESTRGHVAE